MVEFRCRDAGNPYTKSVNEVPYNGSLAHMYSLLSWLDHRVSVVEIAGYLPSSLTKRVTSNPTSVSFALAKDRLSAAPSFWAPPATIGLVELQTYITFTGASHV